METLDYSENVWEPCDPVEMNAAQAAAALATQVNWWIEVRGGTPAQTIRQLQTQIQSYIRLRATHHWSDLEQPKVRPIFPEGWDNLKELLWQEWLDDTYSPDGWDTDVLDPVFGSLQFNWEPQGDWRHELFWSVRRWVLRSAAVVALRDPRPPSPKPTQEELDAQVSGQDPYLVEQEERRRRR
jgi:hypothetical protein